MALHDCAQSPRVGVCAPEYVWNGRRQGVVYGPSLPVSVEKLRNQDCPRFVPVDGKVRRQLRAMLHAS